MSASEDIAELAYDAKRMGLLEIKQSGSIVDISFPQLLADKDRELIHGAKLRSWSSDITVTSRYLGRKT